MNMSIINVSGAGHGGGCHNYVSAQLTLDYRADLSGYHVTSASKKRAGKS